MCRYLWIVPGVCRALLIYGEIYRYMPIFTEICWFADMCRDLPINAKICRDFPVYRYIGRFADILPRFPYICRDLPIYCTPWFTNICQCLHIYIYIYIERERERERFTDMPRDLPILCAEIYRYMPRFSVTCRENERLRVHLKVYIFGFRLVRFGAQRWTLCERAHV